MNRSPVLLPFCFSFFTYSVVSLCVVVLYEFDKAGDGGNLVFAGQITHIDSVIKLMFRSEGSDTDSFPLAVTYVRHQSDAEAFLNKGGDAVFIGRFADDLRMQAIAP